MQLPQTHYDHFRRNSPQVFKFLAKDLARLNASDTLRVEDILPPKSECEENNLINEWAAHVQKRPHLHPELRGGQEAINTMMNQIVREYRSVLGYERYGRKTYFVTEGLAEALCYTQLNVECSEFKLPFECFALVFDSDIARETLHSLLGSPAVPGSTITVYVRDDNLVDAVGFRRLLIVAFETTADGAALASVSRQLALKDDWDLEQALKTDWDKVNLAKPELGVGAGTSMKRNEEGAFELTPSSMEHFFDEGKLFFRLVVNSILYLTSRDAELVERFDGHVKRLPAQRVVDNDEAKRKFFEVGKSVEGIPLYIDPASASSPAAAGPSGRKVKVQSLIPGFYRRPRNSPPTAKKSVWVRPHKRGPEMADLVHRPFIVR